MPTLPAWSARQQLGTRVVRAPYAHLQLPWSPPQRSEVAPLRPSRLTVGLQEAATVQLPQQHGYFFICMNFYGLNTSSSRYAVGGNSSNSLFTGQWISNGRFRSTLMQKNATSYRCVARDDAPRARPRRAGAAPREGPRTASRRVALTSNRRPARGATERSQHQQGRH